jgi:hypothetical protein
MKRLNTIFVLVILTFSLYGCFPREIHSNNTNELPGFWLGTWHGMISAFSFIGSLSNDDIKVYASNNNGHWYDFGFVGGLFFMIRMFIRLIKKPNSN